MSKNFVFDLDDKKCEQSPQNFTTTLLPKRYPIKTMGCFATSAPLFLSQRADLLFLQDDARINHFGAFAFFVHKHRVGI
jgi:hypothetical protein